jgi:histidyl-tRNA synthetase
MPQLFRYEKQQKGRLREHFQFNCDLFGEPGPGADAEVVSLLIDVLRGLGLTAEDFVIRLSTRQAWQQFFERSGGDPARAYEFYQIVDKLDREPAEVSGPKLAELGLNLAQVQEFLHHGEPTPELSQLLQNLAARGLSDYAQVDYGIIRGLAYYTGIVFEAFDRKGKFRAIAGGGRYDGLVKQVSEGKVDLPALGFGMGDVVLAELLKSRNKVPAFTANVDAVVLIEDEQLRSASLGVVQRLRDAGHVIEYALVPQKGDKQFKRAQELAARFTVRLENAPDGLRARVKQLATREEKIVSLVDLAL